MSRYQDNLPENRTKRDELIIKLQEEIRKTPKEDVTTPCHCTARGSEYDPCCCPSVYTPNSRYVELEYKIKKLVQMSFCTCGSAHIPKKAFCTDCGAKVISSTSLHQNCEHWKLSMPYCGSCGKPTIMSN